MNFQSQLTNLCFAFIGTLAAFGPCAHAGPVVFVFDNTGTVLDHRYELKVDAADKDVLGVIVINGFTVFGATGASPIAAPDDWMFIPPIDPDSDGLFYFATASDAEIKMNTSKRGFFFESTQPLVPFKVGLVFADSTTQVEAITPEPSSLLLLPLGLLTFGLWRWTHRASQAPIPISRF